MVIFLPHVKNLQDSLHRTKYKSLKKLDEEIIRSLCYVKSCITNDCLR